MLLLIVVLAHFQLQGQLSVQLVQVHTFILELTAYNVDRIAMTKCAQQMELENAIMDNAKINSD